MNLLIIGNGGHGKVVKEIAEAMNLYEHIDFVDDNSSDAIGKITDLEKLYSSYDSAFVGIGNNYRRKELLQRLRDIGYEIPVLKLNITKVSSFLRKSCLDKFL